MSDLKKHLEKIQKEEAAANFAKWFKDDGILDDNGEPQVLYTGTLSNFSTFDITHTRPEAHFGQGFYLTTSSDDASYNYARREGPDHVVHTDNDRYRLNDDVENFLEQHYADILEGDDEIEIHQKIRQAHSLALEGEEIEESLLDEIFVFHETETFKRVHDGFVLPLFLVSRKLMDVENHMCHTDEDFGEFHELIKHFEENYDNIGYDLRVELESLLTSADDEAHPELEEVLEMLDTAIESNGLDIDDEDDAEKIAEMKAYIEHYYEIDDERCFTYKLSGEAHEIKNHIINILENNGCDSDAARFTEAFNTAFPNFDESFSVKDFLENQEIMESVVDTYVEVDNIYNMHVSGIRALFALAVQQMGYDVIKMDPSEQFVMPHIEGQSHYICFNPLNIKSAIGNNGEYSLHDPDILHRVCKNVKDIHSKENAISFNEASHIIRDIGLHYKNMPKCEIHTNFEDVIHSTAGKDANIETCTGWFDTTHNSIHVYLPNIMNRKELEKTVCHELFGHLSLREIMGNNYESTMNKVYDYYDKKGELEEVKGVYVDRYNLNLNNKKDRALIAEEKMAEVIEQHGFQQFPLKHIIMGAIRNNVRKIVSSLNVNENDITYMMYQSHKNMLEVNRNQQKKKAKIRHH